MKTVLLLCSALALLLSFSATAKEKETLNQELVGKSAPDFTLKNQKNEDVTLSQFEGQKNVVLIFSRASW